MSVVLAMLWSWLGTMVKVLLLLVISKRQVVSMALTVLMKPMLSMCCLALAKLVVWN
jgi:hypothetical protein